MAVANYCDGTIAKLERMTGADFDGQGFDFTGE